MGITINQIWHKMWATLGGKPAPLERVAVKKGLARLNKNHLRDVTRSQAALAKYAAAYRRQLKAEGRNPLQIQALMIRKGLIDDVRLPQTRLHESDILEGAWQGN